MNRPYGENFMRSTALLAIAIFFVSVCAPKPTSAQTKSNLSSSVTSETMTHVWVARERGLFKKYGIDMQFILMPRNPLAIAALLAGEIDAAIIGPGHLINAGLGGATELVGLANFNQKLDYRLNARPEIKKPEDLRGKRIAVSGPGSTSHMVSMLALQGLHIDPAQSKIAFLTIPGTEMNRRLAMESGSVDATSLRGSMGEVYANKGFTQLYNLKTAGVTLPQNMLVTARRTMAAKPQVIEGYLKATIEAISLISDPAHKELVSRLLASNLRLTNPADVEESYQAVIQNYERAPHVVIEGMKRLQKLLAQQNPKVADVKVEALVDHSVMNKLESSGFIASLYKK
ncbi:MAG: ABC transporter substrate-binding protein [Deltaproteobacteria bacterium]|nr:ABC transporter substrate-binding protein [Deltaproteobacteria bacterium]